MTEQTSGAAAYKADHREDAGTAEAQAPRRLHLGRDRPLEIGYREAAIAAGAVGLGVLAYKGVSALLARSADDRVRPEPLARSAGPDVKDNAAPRFAGDGATGAPFMAASTANDTGDLVVAADSARTPEHVPTDLMGDRQPGPDDRAIDAFRPDPTAPVPDAMRDSLRPATGPAPSLAADRGAFAQGLNQTDGSK